jgi:hypothetical protein
MRWIEAKAVQPQFTELTAFRMPQVQNSRRIVDKGGQPGQELP